MDTFTTYDQAYVIDITKKYETLKQLLEGRWVPTEDVQDALGITFADGIKMFEFGRISKWNRAPLNGQRVITKFRLCEKTIEQLAHFPFESEEETNDPNYL